MSASQLTRMVVLEALVASLGAALACSTVDSDPALVLIAAGNNAAQAIAFLASEF